MQTICPSGLIFEARKLRGAELATLAAATERRDAGSGVAEILRATWLSTVEPGPYRFVGAGGAAPDFKRLVNGDVLAALVQARRAVLGDLVDFTARCETCGARNDDLEANLGELELKPIPQATVQAMQSGDALEAKLLDGRKVKFALATMKTDAYLREQHKQMKRRPEWATHKATKIDLTAAQISWVEGLENAKGENVSAEFVKRLEWLLGMDVDWIYDLQGKMTEADGGMDTGVEFTCRECGWEQKTDFPLGRDFFSPKKKKAATRKTEEGETSPTEPKSQETPSHAI